MAAHTLEQQVCDCRRHLPALDSLLRPEQPAQPHIGPAQPARDEGAERVLRQENRQRHPAHHRARNRRRQPRKIRPRAIPDEETQRGRVCINVWDH